MRPFSNTVFWRARAIIRAAHRVIERDRAVAAATQATLLTSQGTGSPSQPPAQLPPGSYVGGYEIEQLIGRGGGGAVYAARQPLIGKRVAIKVLSSTQGDAVQRFLMEARAANLIDHPNIVDIFAFGQLSNGRHYYVMELLRGQTLRERLTKQPPTAAEIQNWTLQLCAALGAAHAAGIAHLDLKPENVWLTSDGQLKLLDFGIAKYFSGASSQPATCIGGLTTSGTPNYMAPEQCTGALVDARTDVYAFGVMLFELFTGSLPFAGSTQEVLAQHRDATPPAAAGAPAAVATLISDCLAKDPARRPQSMGELMDRMRRATRWRLVEIHNVESDRTRAAAQEMANVG
jgi:eukaryotic-like serine/threonine-protein kinase